MEANKIIITGGATRIGAAIAKITKCIQKEDQPWECQAQELKKVKKNGSK